MKINRVNLDNEILSNHFTEEEIYNIYKLLNMNAKQIIVCEEDHYKRCSRCGQIKDISNFRLKNIKRADGTTYQQYKSECRECLSKIKNESYEKRKKRNDTGSL